MRPDCLGILAMIVFPNDAINGHTAACDIKPGFPAFNDFASHQVTCLYSIRAPYSNSGPDGVILTPITCVSRISLPKNETCTISPCCVASRWY